MNKLTIILSIGLIILFTGCAHHKHVSHSISQNEAKKYGFVMNANSNITINYSIMGNTHTYIYPKGTLYEAKSVANKLLIGNIKLPNEAMYLESEYGMGVFIYPDGQFVFKSRPLGGGIERDGKEFWFLVDADNVEMTFSSELPFSKWDK